MRTEGKPDPEAGGRYLMKLLAEEAAPSNGETDIGRVLHAPQQPKPDKPAP